MSKKAYPPSSVELNRNVCKTLARAIKRRGYKKVGSYIDPYFIEGLKEFGVFVTTEPGEFSLQKITKIKFTY